ncbi:MAG: stress response translation initiation inhibitor YciH [Bermanella sp.]
MALVYSTQDGRLCPACHHAMDDCVCKQGSAPAGDGIIRVQKEKKGRAGKTVTCVTGFEGDKKALSDLCKKLKKRFGCGGAVKNWVIELQGDLAQQSVAYLQELGHKVKQSGA